MNGMAMRNSQQDIGFGDDAACWQAVETRDRRADGQFFYAVVTTGIFCRVTCPSRRPRRENAAFFVTAAEAQKAGYRPCLRCHPTGHSPEQAHDAAIRAACALIDEAESPPPLKDLAEAAGLSPFHFHRLFKAVTGVTPRSYMASKRLTKVQSELAAGTPVADALYGAGYGSSSRLYEQAHATLGMTPAALRKGGKGVEIRWTIAATPLGHLIVAATPAGICMIEFGADEADLAARLHSRFPHSASIRADADLAVRVQAIADFIDLPERGLNLPLDIQGTAFQRRVWEALQAIPPGKTASYADIADRLGQPNAARAVARACAANGIALAIPCHRIIRGNGELSGYRWGIDRKRDLLARERRR
jgi:AraC family transcriptional regulator, regulatory protein of adaptative response / methylated-DNA-[protein]-cysteine methyltransferase